MRFASGWPARAHRIDCNAQTSSDPGDSLALLVLTAIARDRIELVADMIPACVKERAVRVVHSPRRWEVMKRRACPVVGDFRARGHGAALGFTQV